MTTTTVVIQSGATWTVPADYTAAGSKFFAFGGGQAGTNGTAMVPGVGGKSADYASITDQALTPGDVLSIQIGTGGASNGAAGGDTWLKNHAGVKILQSKGGASASASIGTTIKAGALGGVVVASYDGSYGNVMTPGFAGSGGGGAPGPDQPGGAGGDTNYAVGQGGGTGGGAGNTAYAAPGQQWLTDGHGAAFIGYGGGQVAGIATGSNGFNIPPGNLDGAAGGGADGGVVPPGTTGGNGGICTINEPFPFSFWVDSVSFVVIGPGGGGGGGGAGFRTNTQGQFDCGNGGIGGPGAGGGGSGGVCGPPGAQPLGSGPGTLWQAFTGALAIGGAGGVGFLAIQYTPAITGQTHAHVIGF